MNPAHRVVPSQPGIRPGWGLFAAELWVLFSAWCSLSGWVLSACGHLDAPGYAAASLTGGVLLFAWRRRAPSPRPLRPARLLCYKRFRRPLPFLFLAAAVLALAGGALHAPVNYDAFTYRLPRLYHWLADARWHWIDTNNPRMNYSGTGFEWLMAPLLLLTRGDRFLFLLNFLPWLLLPGITFCCLREVGVRARVAWHWMWLFPLAHCCLLQAGGIANDTFAVLYILLAVCLALRARRTRRAGDLAIAALAAALCTGSKASNLPLLLPFVIAAWPLLKLGDLIPRKPATLAWLALCAAVSFLPLAALNQLHTGKWTGDPANSEHMELHNPVAAFTGNALQFTVHNLELPVLASLSNGVVARAMRTHFIQALMRDYPRLGLTSGELPDEEGAGEGIGLTLLFLISLAAWFVKRPVAKSGSSATAMRGSSATVAHGYSIALGAWIALGFYMTKIGSEAGPRLVAAYYPLCFMIALLHPGNLALVRSRWWRTAAALAALSVFPALILSPARPLWPAARILSRLSASHPGSALLQRAALVYEVYSHRADLLAPVVRHIPAGTQVVGFLGNADDPSSSLWLPFGGRRVEEFHPGNETALLTRHPGLLLVASRDGIQSQYGMTLETWVAAHGARVLAREPLIVKVHRGPPEDWFLLELDAPAGFPP